jgi:hypothetical protein
MYTACGVIWRTPTRSLSLARWSAASASLRQTVKGKAWRLGLPRFARSARPHSLAFARSVDRKRRGLDSLASLGRLSINLWSQFVWNATRWVR